MPFELDFISEKNFEEHVKNTIKTYNKSLEAIVPKSRNIPWGCSVNGHHVENESIRRVSMDKFYAVVTGDSTAFYRMCMKLPETIEKVLSENDSLSAGKDTVLDELMNIDRDIQKALYKLAFNSYDGFNLC